MKEKKYRISLWTPLPPQKTGIADYVSELLPYLDQFFDLEIFVDGSYSVTGELLATYKIFSYHQYLERAHAVAFDLDVYQIGNNTFHTFIYEQALKVPGVVVLHDLSLSFMLYHEYAGVRNDLESFKKEFLFSEGQDALMQFDRLYNQGDNEGLMDFFSDHHMLRRLVARSYAIISHLDYCAEIAREKYGAVNAYSMYLGSPDPTLELPGVSKSDARRELGIADGNFVMGVFGHLQPNKQNDVVVRALARIKTTHPNVLLTFVGELNRALNYDQYIADLIRKHKLDENVRLTGFVTREDMQKYYLASDVIVNLRYPSFGQMSASLSRGIASGRPVIITDLPEWRFFSDDFCWRVPGKDTEGKGIAELVSRLIENPQELEQRGIAARKFYVQSGTSQIAAENLQKIVQDILENTPRRVMLEETSFVPKSRSDVTRAAFEEWDRIRAGGKYRYRIEKLRRIPIVGPLIFSSFVLFANIVFARKARRAEWALNNSIVDGLSEISKAFKDEIVNLEGKVGMVEGKVGMVNGKVGMVDEKIDNLNTEIRSEYSLEAIHVWDNPLANIAGYQPRSQNQPMKDDVNDMYYIALEQAFRGSEERIKNRQITVLNEIRSYGKLDPGAPILDIGCGRGEFLRLLADEGVHPIGVETNRSLVSKLQEEGFDVIHKDVFDYLATTPDGSFNGITAFHVVEHLTHDQIMALLALVYKKLLPGGFIYLETPNPLCHESLSRFYTDPTHQRPIQPFQLSFMLEYNYFSKTKLLFLEPLKTRGSLSSEKWITLYQDYGVLATKA